MWLHSALLSPGPSEDHVNEAPGPPCVLQFHLVAHTECPFLPPPPSPTCGRLVGPCVLKIMYFVLLIEDRPNNRPVREQAYSERET
jgi:hypothetical protein